MIYTAEFEIQGLLDKGYRFFSLQNDMNLLWQAVQMTLEEEATAGESTYLVNVIIAVYEFWKYNLENRNSNR